MKLLRKLNKQKVLNSSIYIVISIIVFYIGVILYSLIFEQDKLSIDNYNFKQLEKAKIVLDIIPTSDNSYYTLEDFNKKYKIDIKPIKNCYYISTYNGDKQYIFGFQLESMMYRFIHFGKNYAYPSYDLPYERICGGVFNKDTNSMGGGCYNGNKEGFKYTISNPCRD